MENINKIDDEIIKSLIHKLNDLAKNIKSIRIDRDKQLKNKKLSNEEQNTINEIANNKVLKLDKSFKETVKEIEQLILKNL